MAPLRPYKTGSFRPKRVVTQLQAAASAATRGKWDVCMEHIQLATFELEKREQKLSVEPIER